MSSKLVRVDQVEIFEYPPVLSSREDRASEEETEEQEETPSVQDIYQKGYQEGERSAREKGEQQLDAIRKRFAQSIQELNNARQSVIQQTEGDVVRLAMEIAKKLVHREIQIDDKIILTLVRVSLERMGDRNQLVVFVCPSDHEVLRQHLGEMSKNGNDVSWVLKTDKSLQRGDCRVESDSGSVDARMSEQFKEIEDGLLVEL